MSEDSNDQSGDAETTSVMTRWPYTNDILAGLTILSVYLLRGVYLLEGIAAPAQLIWATDALIPGVAAIWLFGTEAYKTLKNG